jgi:hypothetical protein
MKNLLKTGLVLIALTATTTAFASTVQFEIGKIANEKKLLIGLKGETKDNLQLKIYDEYGNHVYTDNQFNSEGFVRLYDLSEVGTDKFTIEMRSSDDQRTATVDFSKEADKSKFIAYFPHSSAKELQVSYANASSSVNIKIKNNDGKKVYELDMPAKAAESFVANLEKLKSGYYQVIVSSDGTSYTKNVTVK